MNRRQPVAAPILFSFCTSRMASCYGNRYRYTIVMYVSLCNSNVSAHEKQ